jgi:hypothetical protein
MKTKLIFISFVFFTSAIFAQGTQEGEYDTLWTPKGTVGVNLSQVSFTNWAQGGENSLTFVLFSNFGIHYLGYPIKWKNTLKTTYGKTKIGGGEFRTNDNEIFFESTFIYQLGWSVSPYFGVTARSAITDGYNYNEEPPVQIVEAFDPFFLSEAVGFTYDEITGFNTRLGIGFKQTFARKFDSLYTDNPETAFLEDFKNESGIESVTELTYEFLTNVTYYSYLRLFGTFEDLNIWDVRWDNIITGKVNNYINVKINVLLLYDVDETAKTQLKEALQLGLQYTLF